MDHNEAVRLNAAEKYVLGELPQGAREEYEEHYFDCPECALDLKSAAAFVDASREVFREEGREKNRVKSEAAAPSRWFSWLQPIVAVPALAALAAIIAYQYAVTIPAAKQGASHGVAQLIDSSIPLHMANVRGEGGLHVRIPPNAAFTLDFDFTPSRVFDNYLAELQDQAGRSVLQVHIPAQEANREVHLFVPAGLVHSGKYTLVLAGDPGAKGRMAAENEVERFTFVVESRQYLHQD